MPSINTDVGLKPSARKILSHLERRGSISPVEAQVSYSLMRLAPAIYDLRQAGYDITTERRRDDGGHPYAHYTLTAKH